MLKEVYEATKERKSATEELETIRKDRTTLLLDFTTRLRRNLDDSYRLLTEQEDGTFGTVTLYVENED